MTNLELLQHIKNAPAFKGGDSRYINSSNSSVLYDKDIDKIERDLKVLSILKDRILNHSDYKISGWAELNFEIDEADSKETKAEDRLIKRWLDEQ